MAPGGKLTKKLVAYLGPSRHGDGNGLYLVVDPSGARRWIVRVVVKGQRNKKGGPFRTDFGLGGADIVVRSRYWKFRQTAWLNRAFLFGWSLAKSAAMTLTRGRAHRFNVRTPPLISIHSRNWYAVEVTCFRICSVARFSGAA